MKHSLLLVSALLVACGPRAAEEPASESVEPSAGSEAEAPAGPRVTGTWAVGGTAFTPDVALAFPGENGSYEIRIASPAIDCAFARHRGTPPANLREVRIHELAWEPGTAVQSSGQSMTGQVVCAYDDADGQQNVMPNGTVTPGAAPSGPGAVGTIQLAVSDGEDPAQNAIEGEIDVTLCP
jgi:hypothetical protein